MDESASETRVWLVERSYDDRGLITLAYATPDGTRVLRKERAAATMRMSGSDITAALDVPETRLEPVPDDETVQRYAEEATRVEANNDPDDAI